MNGKIEDFTIFTNEGCESVIGDKTGIVSVEFNTDSEDDKIMVVKIEGKEYLIFDYKVRAFPRGMQVTGYMELNDNVGDIRRCVLNMYF
jgi:hypothetical protein